MGLHAENVLTVWVCSTKRLSERVGMMDLMNGMEGTSVLTQ